MTYRVVFTARARADAVRQFPAAFVESESPASSLDFTSKPIQNAFMEIRGRVHNGVVMLESPLSLPEGTEVTVLCDLAAAAQAAPETRVEFPLVRSKRPGTLQLTAERIAEFLEEEDVSA